MYQSFFPARNVSRPPRLPFRVIGRDLPTESEPATVSERARALVWYADAVKRARGYEADAINAGYGELSFHLNKCRRLVIKLEKERRVWIYSERFAVPDGMPGQARPFNQFSTSKGVN